MVAIDSPPALRIPQRSWLLLKSLSTRIFDAPQTVFYGWWIVAISAVSDSLKHGTFNRGFTFYVTPLSEKLGVGVGIVSLAEMLGRMEGGLQGPLLGWLNDKFGPRFIMVLGGAASGLGFIMFSFTESYIYFLVVFVGLMSMGFRAGFNNALMPAINQWFRRRRGLAMAVAGMGSPLGGILIAPMMGLLVYEIGWVITARIAGIAILSIVLPLSIFVYRSPEERGLLPDGANPATDPMYQGRNAAGTARPYTFRPLPGEPDFTVGEAMRTPTYWLLVLAVGLRNTVHSGKQFLLSPVIVWFLMGSGRPEDDSFRLSALLVGLLSLSSLVMNPIFGWMGDKFSKQKLSSLAMIAGTASVVVVLNHSGALWQAYLFVLFLAVTETANPLAWAIMGDFFGRRSYATLRGWQHLPDQLMSMSTPVWMGLVFDFTGSYFWALVPLAVIYSLAAVSYWVIPTPKSPVRVLAAQGA